MAGSPWRVPTYRYTSPEFAALEVERMWPKVWQIACSVDHVAAPGDWFEYRVGPYSILLVRGDDGGLRAFQNVCRHRGNSLCTGAGEGLTEIRCGYHRWAWDLQGLLKEVPSRKDFGVLRNEDLPLFPARVATWGPLVFVNLDMAAMPLEEYLEALPGDIAWVGVDEFRCEVTASTTVEVNWKIVVDGFSETYHVQGIHREMLPSMDDVNNAQDIWGHTSKSSQPYGVPSPRLRGVTEQQVWDSFIVTQGGRMGVKESCPVPEPPAGQTVQDVIAQGIRRTQAAAGADLSRFDTDEVLRLHQYNIFPNATVLVSADLFQVICARPGSTPGDAEMVALSMKRVSSADAPRSSPFDVVMGPDQANFGFVLNQDLGVLAGMQRGVRQPGLTHFTLSLEECRVVNTHRNLERYLGIEPTELSGGPAQTTDQEARP